ncbi:MAG: SpoVG family protein [Oscillospiraceae bacterium]|nr:SpoVG family protein [Oscillospiraceae bacterium]MBQ9947368.1 SpoVG family protein [Oscillospiraceae bacterium]
MTISEIKIRKTFDEGNLKAIASVVLDDCFAVHDIKVIQGGGRLFVAMPSRKDECGAYRDIVHPMCAEARNRFEEAIIDEYERFVAVEDVMEKENTPYYCINRP